MNCLCHCVVSTDIDERSIGDRSTAGNAANLVRLLAHRKADAILDKIRSGSKADIPSDSILVTADQVIVCNGSILEKPEDAVEARNFLRGYSSNCCSTIGSIVLTRVKDNLRVEVVQTLHYIA